MELKKFVGPVFGLLLLASAFVPLAAYHGLGDVTITGTLWSFMLPTGWFSIIAGVVLLIHQKIGLKNKRLTYALFLISVFLVLLFLLQDVDYYLSLWHGIEPTNFDVDQILLAYVSLPLAALGIFASLLLSATQNFRPT